MEDGIIAIAFFAVVFGIVYIVTTARHKERMAMISSGANPELFKNNFSFRINPYSIFKWGMFLVGIAFGIIMGNILSAAGILDEDAAYPGMIFFFGGLSLIISYLLKGKLDKQQ